MGSDVPMLQERPITAFHEEVTILTALFEIKEVRNLSKLQQLFWHMAVHTLWSCVMRIEKTAQSIAHISIMFSVSV